MKRKLLVVIEALIVLAGAFMINVHLLGKQSSLPFGAKPGVAATAVVTTGALPQGEEGSTAREAPSLVRMPAPFTADEVDRLSRELFTERERLKTENDRLARERVELERIAKDLRSRRETLANRLKEARARRDGGATAAAARKAGAKPSSADAKAMAGIFDKMRADSAAQRLAVMEPRLAARVLGRMNPKMAAKALGVMDPIRAAALAAKIPPKRRRTR